MVLLLWLIPLLETGGVTSIPEDFCGGDIQNSLPSGGKFQTRYMFKWCSGMEHQWIQLLSVFINICVIRHELMNLVSMEFHGPTTMADSNQQISMKIHESVATFFKHRAHLRQTIGTATLYCKQPASDVHAGVSAGASRGN